jgi:tetratricopeptide (TPR) repeat protein
MRTFRYIPFLFIAVALFGQSARWEPSEGSLAYGQTSQLQLVFDGCAPKGQPTPPAADGIALQYAGESNQTSIINGTVSKSVTLSYAARPTKKTDLTISEFSVDTDKGKIVIPAAHFSVGDATVGNGVSLESIANSTLIVPASVWAGEVFSLEYNLNVRQRNAPNVQNLLGSLLDWKPAPLVIEDWPKPAARDSLVNGDTFITIYQKTRASIAKPGTVTLTEGTQLVNIAKGVDFFGRYVLDQFSITSNKPVIQVKPLPTSAPASFHGAVGQFTLKSNVVPTTANVGEPVTWTLTLSGTGNWPDISGLPARSVSKDFKAVQPQARRTPKEGMLFDATLVEDVVLIPTKPGSYTLGPLTWSYFDPAKGEYQTVVTPSVTVSINPAPETNKPAQTSSVIGASSGSPTGKTPAMPKGIPRDPQPDQGAVSEPLAATPFVFGLCVPFALLLLFWLFLAYRKAFLSDPARPAREAKRRLATTLATMGETKDPATTASLLLTWQKDVAVLWELPSSAPAASSFPSAEKAWIQLWSESDRTLYREATPLPADWTTRALAALQEKRVPGFSFFQLFRPKHLFPFAALLLLTFIVAFPSTVRAASGTESYARGDFAGAEKAWREVLAKEPANPAAHHNLSLALAQQDRWSEAAAHAAAAFVQKPTNEAFRWNLALSFERAGFAPSVFTGFAASHPPHQLAQLFSPAQWQWIAVLASLLLAAGFAFLLFRAYGGKSRWLKYSAFFLFSLSGVLGAAAALSLRVYSPVNDARAAVVWHATTLRSLPTEVDTPQKTSPLAAGSVALADQTFIPKTWVRLVFTNGQTGWVRQEDIVPLWR